MPFVTIKGSPGSSLNLHYQDFSKEKNNHPPVILLHGFTLDHRSWAANAAVIGKSFRVIVPDAKGHGLSDAPPSGYGRADRVEDLLGLLDALKIEKLHLVGLSMGGSTAIGFALKYPDRLVSLTLVDTGAAGYKLGTKISHIDRLAKEEGIEAARRRWMKMTLGWYKDDNKEIGDLIATMMKEHSGAIWLDEKRGKYPRTNDLDHVAKIKLPTLILVGELDSIFVPLSRELHEKINGSRLSVYEGVGHMLSMEAPRRFNDELLSFINGVNDSL